MGAKLSVIIVNYRTPALTILAVQSALEDGADQVVVIDNSSGDDSLERLLAIRDERVVVVASDTNAGFGNGANQGAAASTNDVIVFLNSDATLRPGALATIADEVKVAGGRTIVGPRLIGADAVVQRSAGLVPKPDDLVVRALGLHRLAQAISNVPGVASVIGGRRITTEYDQAITATEAINVSMVSGACFGIGREAFAELGGFDERYFMYFEDADLCRRALAVGWPVLYAPDALVDHIGGASASGDYRFGQLHGPSMVVYLKRWYGAPGGWLALLLLLARAVGKSASLQPDRSAARTGLMEGVRAYRRERSRSPRPARVPVP